MTRVRTIVALAYALVLADCGRGGDSSTSNAPASATPTLGPATTAHLWIQPKPLALGATGLLGGGSADFDSLFTDAPRWATTLAHTAAFGFYAGWVADTDDATLATAVGFLNAHHLPVALEAPALQATAACGTGTEGYVPDGQSLAVFTNAYLQRLKALGADVRYIKVDEPFFFGSIAASDPHSCAWPLGVVAQAVADYVRLVHAVYPNAQVGDVEPMIAAPFLTDPVTSIERWHDAFAAASGSAFPFYIADMDFGNPGWPQLAVQMQQAMHARGETFGIIFIGDPTDTSDVMWASKTLARARTFASTTGSAPDVVFFQSWDPYPQHCLPENDPTTFTGVVLSSIDDATGQK